MSRLEHVNLTVSNPDASAALIAAVFGWEILWQGPSQLGGRTIHIGNAQDYLALYTHDGPAHFAKGRPLNHIGIVVDDLAATEARVVAAGLTPFNHGDYEPGRRFYILDGDGIEFEVVSYG